MVPLALTVIIALVALGLGAGLGWWLGRKPSDRTPAPSSRPPRTAELYVGNLGPETTEEQLRAAFEPFGKVVSVRIVNSRLNGRSRRFAFVMMASPEHALAAIRGMNGKDLQGRKLAVSEARSRPRRKDRDKDR